MMALAYPELKHFIYSNEGRFVHYEHFDKLTMHVYEINIVTEILLKLPPEVAQQS